MLNSLTLSEGTNMKFSKIVTKTEKMILNFPHLFANSGTTLPAVFLITARGALITARGALSTIVPLFVQ